MSNLSNEAFEAILKEKEMSFLKNMKEMNEELIKMMFTIQSLTKENDKLKKLLIKAYSEMIEIKKTYTGEVVP